MSIVGLICVPSEEIALFYKSDLPIEMTISPIEQFYDIRFQPWFEYKMTRARALMLSTKTYKMMQGTSHSKTIQSLTHKVTQSSTSSG